MCTVRKRLGLSGRAVEVFSALSGRHPLRPRDEMESQLHCQTGHALAGLVRKTRAWPELKTGSGLAKDGDTHQLVQGEEGLQDYREYVNCTIRGSGRRLTEISLFDQTDTNAKKMGSYLGPFRGNVYARR